MGGGTSKRFLRSMNKGEGLAKGQRDGANPLSSSQPDQQPQLRKRRNDQDCPRAAKRNRDSAEAPPKGISNRYKDPPQSKSPSNPPQTSHTDTQELHLPQPKAPSSFPQTPQNDTQELVSRKNHQDASKPDLLSIEDDCKRRSKYWEIAWNTLSTSHKSVLETANIDKENLEHELKDLRGRMNMVPSFDGLSKPVMIRAKINQILSNVQCFSELVGSGSASNDYSEPTGFVWAGVTFALNLAVKDMEMFEVISNMVERMTTLLCSCETHDKVFFQQKNEFALNSIPPIYAASLQLSALAFLYTQKPATGHVVGRALKPFEQEVDSISKAITEGKSQLEKFALEAQDSTSSNIPRHLKRQERRQILDWLSLVKPKDNHNHARRNRAVGSGEWLFQKPEFVQWIEVEDSSILWLYGKAGAGKTVLSCTIIDSLLATYPINPVLYFYCHYKEEARQQEESILRTLYRDLAAFAANDTLDQALIAEYEHWESRGRCSSHLDIDKVKEFFLAEASKYNSIFLVIDALDECDDSRLRLIKYLIETLTEGAKHCQFKIFLTSRHDNKIQALLGAKLKYEINANDTSKDIRPFVKQRVKAMISERQLLSGNVPAGIEEEIIEALCRKADGMFLWVDFQLQSIGELANINDIRLQLQELPDNLEETYARMMARIDKKPARARRWAYRALAWVFGAKKLLSPEQLVQATAIQVGSETVSSNDFPSSVEYLVDLCCHMIVIDRSSSRTTVRFVHFSVQEFLAPHAEFQSVGQLCGATCLTAIGIYQHGKGSESQHDLIPSFYIYAVRNTMQYADSIGHMPYHQLVALLDRINLVHLVHCVVAARYSRNRPDYAGVIQTCLNKKSIGFVSLLAYFNFSKVLEYEIETNLADSDTITTLMVIALARGNTKCAQVLLSKGFEVNSTLMFGNDEITVLYLICYHLYARVELAQLLIEAGADVNLQGGEYGTALQAAAIFGKVASVKLLLEAGADVNLQGGKYGTALQAAALWGEVESVKLLLEAGADVNLQGGEYGTALQAAAYRGYISVVRLLLDAGADVNKVGGKYGTALSAARAKFTNSWGHPIIESVKIDIANMLVNAGAK